MLGLRGSRERDEDGAVAILVAICAVFLCIAAAMVVDLGILRVDKQRDKSAQDAAAIAGVNGLISNSNSPVLHPFAGVCQAINYLKVNDSAFSNVATSSWSTGTGAAIAGDPDGCASSHETDVCTPSTPASWARWVGTTTDGTTRVTIQSGYKTVESSPATDGNVSTVTGGAFPEESLAAYAGDPGAVAYGGCDQLAVIVNEVKNTTLGSPAVAKMGTRLRSVGRVKIIPPTTPFALLILNRTDCLALANNSNGTITVSGVGVNPGLIHIDSKGTGTQCGAKSVAQGAKSNGIVAQDAPSGGAQGEISMVATTNMTDGLANVHAGASPGRPPVSSSLVTRSVLDSVYQSGVQAAVSAASPFVTATVAPAGWTTIQGGACPNGSGTTTYAQTQLFMKCGNVNKSVSMPNATDVIFNGQVGADLVSMPKATRVYIAGGTSPAGVSIGTTFEMNNVTAGASCSTSSTPSAARARLFIGAGSLKAGGGMFRACNTTVIMMGGDTTKACVPTTSPTYLAANAVCTTSPNSGNGTLDFSGGANTDWTAPDLDDDMLPAPTIDHGMLEDLALWTETSGTQGVGGGGTLHLMGVFAAPNGDLVLNGGPAASVANSQYVAKTLKTTGSGSLSLTPQPSLPVAPPQITYFLVR